MQLEKLYPYDVETYKNTFTMYIGNAKTRKCFAFEISDRRDDRNEMYTFLKQIKAEDGYMVGFNNIGFDYPVVHFILTNMMKKISFNAHDIYLKAMSIIKAQNSDEKFANMVPERKHLVKQIDLFKIHHFDNKARATSLKMLEFNMRSDNIEDLPFEVGISLTEAQIKTLLKYNKHDMSETMKFLMHSLNQIEFREQLSDQYGKNFLNYNDTKIGKNYFIMKLEEANPGCCYDENYKVRQTIRSKINLADCILPYVEFKRPEFKAVLDWLRSKTIKQTKGVFTDILESDLGELAKYCTLRTKRKKFFKKPTDSILKNYQKKHPMGWLDEKILKSGKPSYYWCWNVADNLNCVIDGFQYDFGTGGIHGSTPNSIYISTKKRKIKTKDVTSYYPNLSIKNRFFPEHLGEIFCDIYEDMFNQRSLYPKGTPENAMLKLALNGTYGASNDVFSPFYDPMFTMKITINGQLLLCMLAEWLMDIPTVKIIMMNTDGLEYTIDTEYEAQAEAVCKKWEELTMLQLEGGEYKKMCIRDVNNYIAVSE